MDMKIRLEPVNETNREAVLALTVREDQPFVAPNDVSLQEAADEAMNDIACEIYKNAKG